MEKYNKIIKFIRKLYNQDEGIIPLHAPVFKGNEKKYLNECIDTTFVSSVGRFVDCFEKEVAKYTDSTIAVACVNGTNALHIALLLADVKPNDEVITQPLTFIATVNAIIYAGAHPVFVDVDRNTPGLSPEALHDFLSRKTEMKPEGCINKITKRKIKACVPMHTYGHPCKIDQIISICQSYNIKVIEDAAESMGSLYKGKHTGTFGAIGVLSFNGNKIITTGGGGMLLFQDEVLAKKAKHLTTQAKLPHQWEFFHDDIGYNYRMPNINAALGLAQLKQLDTFILIKRAIAQEYRSFFDSVDVPFIKEPVDTRSNYWLNSILLENKKERDKFLDYSNKNNIMTRPAWTLMNRLPMFLNAQTGNISNAEWFSERLVNIPSGIKL